MYQDTAALLLASPYRFWGVQEDNIEVYSFSFYKDGSFFFSEVAYEPADSGELTCNGTVYGSYWGKNPKRLTWRVENNYILVEGKADGYDWHDVSMKPALLQKGALAVLEMDIPVSLNFDPDELSTATPEGITLS